MHRVLPGCTCGWIPKVRSAALKWALRQTMDGEAFAAGHSERGNDPPLPLSTSKAERVDDGYRVTGGTSRFVALGKRRFKDFAEATTVSVRMARLSAASTSGATVGRRLSACLATSLC